MSSSAVKSVEVVIVGHSSRKQLIWKRYSQFQIWHCSLMIILKIHTKYFYLHDFSSNAPLGIKFKQCLVFSSMPLFFSFSSKTRHIRSQLGFLLRVQFYRSGEHANNVRGQWMTLAGHEFLRKLISKAIFWALQILTPVKFELQEWPPPPPPRSSVKKKKNENHYQDT